MAFLSLNSSPLPRPCEISAPGFCESPQLTNNLTPGLCLSPMGLLFSTGPNQTGHSIGSGKLFRVSSVPNLLTNGTYSQIKRESIHTHTDLNMEIVGSGAKYKGRTLYLKSSGSLMAWGVCVLFAISPLFLCVYYLMSS